MYGNTSLVINGSSGNDQIFDKTEGGTTNTINGGAGNDTLAALDGSHKSILNGGAGNDTLIGGAGDELYGSDGADTLLAFNGAAYLSGGAGSDILVNSFLGANGANHVVMSGGSGTDTFALMGSETSYSLGSMMTKIMDLNSGDRIDLGFLETSAGSDLDPFNTFIPGGALVGKASIVSGSLSLDLKGLIVSNEKLGVSDDDSRLSTDPVTFETSSDKSELLIVGSNASKVSTAISKGFSESTITNYDALFGSLTDTYQNH